MQKRLLLLSICLFLSALVVSNAGAQSITSGAIAGTVTDPSGAGVPNAAVTLTNVATNATLNTLTGVAGNYRFAFIPIGTYSVTVKAPNFQTAQLNNVTVASGQPTPADIQLQVATQTQTVQVTEAATVIQSENADVSTNFSPSMVQNLPNPGGDITYIVQTTPGAVMNTQAGYGNVVIDGMPATSNNFMVNGANDNDPFFGINNSGASNLLLGSNDIAEANVISNPYSGQYGQAAGAQVAYITKSGTNLWHGNAIYNWNGRYLNANQFFSNSVGQPTPFNNFNQWQVNANGPIIKNKTFFDFNYEGVHSILPSTSRLIRIPSPQFESATLANLTATGRGAEIPFYNKVFSVYNGAPNAAGATPVAGGGCAGFTGLGAGVPCALQFRTTPGNLLTEYQWSARVDHTFGERDRFYVRVLRDNGFQPTFTSPFGPTFNEESRQPELLGQISETHTFGPRTVNEFKGSALFYQAQFGPADPNAQLAALPTFLSFAGNAFTGTGAFGQPGPFLFPQGRRVFQYQVLDDLSHVMGKHTFRMGFSWLHDNITDLDFSALAGPINGAIVTNVSEFFAGGGVNTALNQAFPSQPQQYLRYNTFSGYLADDWKVNDRLTMSLNLRLENYGNVSCDNNCFARLSSQFTGAPNPTAASTPYNQFILSGQKWAYPNTQTVIWEPRVGMAWRPLHSDHTVIRAGAGIFSNGTPGAAAENAAFNSPSLNSFTLGNGLIAPGVPGSLFGAAAAANQTLLSQFASGGSFNTISAALPGGFAPPTFYSFPDVFYQPKFYRWNFEVQQGLGAKMVFSANYKGNHGIRIPILDGGLNAFCGPDVCPTGFAGLPTTAPNPALGTVNQYLNGATSSYNGLTLSLQRRMANNVAFNVSYTWSHSLDSISNGGIANEPFGILATNISVTQMQDPHSIRSLYGNSDYDVRHYLSASLVLTDVFHGDRAHWGGGAARRALGGWTLSTNWFYRTGLPFTLVDTAASSALLANNFNGPIFATPLAGGYSTHCTNNVDTPCFSTSQFAPSTGAPTGFGTIQRNSIFGPRFFDVDASLTKAIVLGERVTLEFGASAFNLLNHTNLDQPVADIADPSEFGRNILTVGPPTSVLGSFVGAGSSPRFLEIHGAIRF